MTPVTTPVICVHLKKKIVQRVKIYEESIIEMKLKNIENMKNDSNKYYAALREMSNMQKPKPVIVTDKQGKVAGTTAKKLELITEYFKKALAPKEMEEKYKSYKPAQMRRKFTKEEIKKIAKRLKNGKSAGIDKLNAEFIKYAPDAIYEHIANTYNCLYVNFTDP